MTCEEARARLDELIDGALDATEAAAVEQHLGVCAACRTEREVLQTLLARTQALPRERLPERDLWPDIASQLVGQSRGRRFGIFGMVAALPAAAALLLLAGALGGAWWSGRGDQGTGTSTAPAPAVIADRQQGARADARVLAAAEPGEAPLAEEQRYQEAVASLRAAIEARRGSLSPATLEVVEHNLAVVDEALRDIRRALRADPGNALLSQLLSSTNQQKVAVLERLLALAERS